MSMFSWFTKKESTSQPVIEMQPSRDLSKALNAMGIGFMVIDRDDLISEINTSCLALLGLTKISEGSKYVEVLGTSKLIQFLKTTRDQGALVEEIDGSKEGGKRFLASFSYEKTLQETLVVLLDITRKNALETVRRDFISNVSHELRTPVSVIRANAESLMDGALEDKAVARKFTQVILKNSVKLTNLLSDILNLSTIESGEYRLELKNINVNEVLPDLVISLSEPEGHTIQIILDKDLQVYADSQAFEQIITNLVENAMKYGNEDGKTLIQIKGRDVGSFVKFELEDGGPGVPAEQRDRIFERFYRVQSELVLSNPGTGLGLSIVKNLVNQMGGDIGVEPAYPKGAIFWFTLTKSIK